MKVKKNTWWKKYINGFREGDISVRLSYLIMGFANLRNGQIIKGLIFLLAEIGFIAYMVMAGASSIVGLITLGTQAQGWVMDESLGIKVQVEGDNSMLCMIYGLATIMIVLKEAMREPMAEFKKFTASLLTPTKRSKAASRAKNAKMRIK